MEDLSKKTVCFVDSGLFISWAELVAPHFGRTLYTTPTQNAFELSAEHLVGEGIPGVDRLKTPSAAYRMADDIDLWVFTDILYRDDQAFLRSRGARVWGAGDAELLELDRLKFRRLVARLGLDSLEEITDPKGWGKDTYLFVRGMDAAEEFIKERPGKPFNYLKTARHDVPYRGDFETLRYRSFREVEYRLQEIRRNLGSHASEAEFIIEPHVEGVEIACDVYSIDGQFPSHGCMGLEIKGDCWIGKYVPYDHYPEGMREINDLLGPTLKKTGCRQNTAIETRVTKDGSYYAQDPCMRFGRPSMGTQLMYSNWPEIFWEGAGGNLVSPKKQFEWVAEFVMDSDYAEEHPLPIECPKELLPNLKLSNACQIKGKRICVPHPRKLSMVGTFCVGGSTMKEAIQNARDASKEITGYRLELTDEFDKAEEQIEELKGYGIQF